MISITSSKICHYQRGVVRDIDPISARARVILPGSDHLVSWWLDILHTKTHGDTEFWLPDIGADVACLIDPNGESGCILGGLYTQNRPPQSEDPDVHDIRYRDGTRISYNRKANHMEISLAGSGTLNVSGVAIRLNADVTINGNLDVSENVSIGGTQNVTGPANFLATGTYGALLSAPAISWGGGSISDSGNVAIDGAMTVSQGISATGDIQANGISLSKHTHQSGAPGSSTSPPS